MPTERTALLIRPDVSYVISGIDHVHNLSDDATAGRLSVRRKGNGSEMGRRSAPVTGIDDLIERTGHLHSAPAVALRIVKIMRSPTFRTEDVVACLQNDPPLAASILKLVNSSRFGLRYKVSGIQQAVAYLGCRALRLTVLSFGLVRQLTGNGAGEFYELYWKRALTMACAASLCASRTGEDTDEAFTAGLLADLGMLVLAQSHGKEYAELALVVDNSEVLVIIEQERFGFDHAAVTGRLLENWNLPPDFVEATTKHHQVRPSDGPLQRLLRVSGLFADVLWWPQSSQMESLGELLADEFDCDVDDLIDMALACRKSVAEAAEIFGVQLPSEIDIDMVQAEARKQLESVTLDAVLDLDMFEAMSEN